MSIPFRDHLDLGGVARITNVAAPTASTDVARLGDIESALENLNWKDNVRVATQSNVNLASPGATIDGVTLSTADRVLVKAQTAEAENGIYVFNGASSAMTRAADADTGDSLLSAKVAVDEGTDAGTSWRQSEIAITLETDDVLFVTLLTDTPDASETVKGKVELATAAEVNGDTGGSRVVTSDVLNATTIFAKKVAVDFGDGAATQYDIAHNLDTEDVTWIIRYSGGNKNQFFCAVRVLDSNTIRVNVLEAPTSDELRAIIIG